MVRHAQGNDPIILSGTPFLAYMTRVSSNITQPRAWIYMQFAVANIASAILVSSNPTNLVLAGAFQIKFINYTANMIVPVAVTTIVMFPFLLYVLFRDESLVPKSIQMYELSEEAKAKEPVNPNIPFARGIEGEHHENGTPANKKEEEDPSVEHGFQSSLEEIMNPFLDKGGAAFGALIMAVTLITVLALNAALSGKKEVPVFWVTLPAAFIMFCWDVAFGWLRRHETRAIARRGRREVEEAHKQQAMNEKGVMQRIPEHENEENSDNGSGARITVNVPKQGSLQGSDHKTDNSVSSRGSHQQELEPTTLVSLYGQASWWLQTTFPTVMTIFAHLPFALVPFAFCMFVLVQALATKGWIPVFAHGWDHWVNKTGVVGSIGGMGFLSVILCNVSYSRGVARNSRLTHKPNSLPEPTLAPPSFSVGLFKHGSRSIT